MIGYNSKRNVWLIFNPYHKALLVMFIMILKGNKICGFCGKLTKRTLQVSVMLYMK